MATGWPTITGLQKIPAAHLQTSSFALRHPYSAMKRWPSSSQEWEPMGYSAAGPSQRLAEPLLLKTNQPALSGACRAKWYGTDLQTLCCHFIKLVKISRGGSAANVASTGQLQFL